MEEVLPVGLHYTNRASCPTQVGRHSTRGGKYGSFWLILQPSQGLRFRRFQGAEGEKTQTGFYWSISNRGWGSGGGVR